MYLISAVWSARSSEGAWAIALEKNGVKLPYMNYFGGTAPDSLTSVTPTPLLVSLLAGDILSLKNYAPSVTLAAPVDNIPSSSPNAAASINFIRLVGYL